MIQYRIGIERIHYLRTVAPHSRISCNLQRNAVSSGRPKSLHMHRTLERNRPFFVCILQTFAVYDIPRTTVCIVIWHCVPVCIFAYLKDSMHLCSSIFPVLLLCFVAVPKFRCSFNCVERTEQRIKLAPENCYI